MNTTTVDAPTADVCLRMPAYPLSILIGCAALDESDAFHALPDGFWRVVTRLVKKISVATPSQVIFAKRETLARESGKSVETVGRALRWMEDHGFITRVQKARAGLRGSEAPLQPTAKLINALGIGQRRRPGAKGLHFTAPTTPTVVDDRVSATVSTESASASAPLAPPPVVAEEFSPDLSTTAIESVAESAVKNDASISALQVHSLINKRQSDETRASTSAKTEPRHARRMVVVDGKIIPSDLAWMTQDSGLPATGILRLMKLASQAGKRLSDIVACCRAALASLRGKALFAYVRKLIGQDKDYAGMVRQDGQKAAQEHQHREDKALVGRKEIEWCGQRFISKDQQRVWTVEGTGFIVLQAGHTRSSRRMDKGFVEAVMNGDLRRLVAA